MKQAEADDTSNLAVKYWNKDRFLGRNVPINIVLQCSVKQIFEAIFWSKGLKQSFEI